MLNDLPGRTKQASIVPVLLQKTFSLFSLFLLIFIAFCLYSLLFDSYTVFLY